MFRTTQSVTEIRRWAESRDGRPCRDEGSGRLGIALPGQPCEAREVGWDEFEVAFRVTGCVFLYEDAPGSRRLFVGSPDDARAWMRVACAPAARP
ncbi:hypothetical protein [Anaeromyxobacter sp. Fw109-5]|uniref:hypothetical protein n=1 Tax=Anaeromyxobacter sp. (strain Fw109-5) TaxID=404589 RepID=UPI0000ED6E88|nr:hypothetical protein [Anaeromyxobacter sp. Fw109-5]